MRSIFGSLLNRNQTASARDRGHRAMRPGVLALESRDLKTAAPASVALTGGVLSILPSAAGSTAIVSYQTVSGTQMVDARVDGVDHYFAPQSIININFDAQGAGGNMTFENDTTIEGIAFGGNGANDFISGGGINVFYGGSSATSVNTFDCTQGSSVIFQRGASNTVLHDGGYSVTI